MKNLTAFLLASFFIAAPVSAQPQPSKPSLQQYLNIRATAAPALSPDGSQYAFLWAITGTPQIWVSKTDGGFPQQVTFFEDRVDFVDWSPTEDLLLFGKSSGGNEKTQLYTLKPDGTNLTALTNNLEVIYNFGGFARDGKSIAYSSNERRPQSFDVYLMRLDTKASRRVVESDTSYNPGGFSPDGKYLVLGRGETSLNNDLYLLDLGTLQRIHLTPHEGDARYSGLGFTSKPGELYIVTNKGRNFASLATTTFKDGKIGDLKFIEVGNYDVEGLEISDDGTYLSYRTIQDGYFRMTVKNLKTGETVFVTNPSSLSNVSFTPDSKKFVLTYASGTQVVERFLYEPVSKKMSQISFPSYAGLARESFVEPQLIKYKSFDGAQIPAFLYLPKSAKKDGSLPLIINYHGGPEGQSQPYFDGLIQYLVASGYAVLQPNVRGSSGYGKAYLDADNATKREVSLKDGIAAAEWAKSAGYFNPKKLIAYGGSYGGYMTLAMVTFYPDTWAAGVDVVGISNMISFLKNTGAYRQKNRIAEYGDPEKDAEFLKKISPLYSVDKIKAALMVIQGANDPRVPKSEADQIVEAVKKKGGVVEYQLFEDEGHGLAKLKNRIKGYTAMVDFLDKYVKNKP